MTPCVARSAGVRPGKHDDRSTNLRKLGELLAGLVNERDLAPYLNRLVSGVYDDSRQIRPNGLFVAVRGSTVDGRRFVPDALARGATVLVGEDLPQTDEAIVLNVPDAREVLARLAARWYGLDAEPQPLALLGITGTNGKTTTAIMTRAIVQAAGRKCGLLGTVRYDLCGRSVAARITTPGAIDLAAYLRECADAGASVAVMEISSHAIDQRRTAGLPLRAAAFTNLSGDHLDYHGTVENYRATKARLFAELDADAVAVVNRDDPAAEFMVRACPARIVWYSMERDAEIVGTVSRDSIGGTYYRMRVDGAEFILENAIVGRHNVYNALAAAGLARVLGLPLEAIQAGLSSVRNIPGRLQRVPCVGGADVFVDYAHTDDALRNVLSVLKPLARGRLSVVFGCGGDRDRTKRPRMAQAAEEWADRIVVTSDNPRQEAPEEIIDDIVAGFSARGRAAAVIEPDRRRAIAVALVDAGEGDVVLIAGKGHEDYQIVGDQRIHFDDVEVAIQAAAQQQSREAGETR